MVLRIQNAKCRKRAYTWFVLQVARPQLTLPSTVARTPFPILTTLNGREVTRSGTCGNRRSTVVTTVGAVSLEMFRGAKDAAVVVGEVEVSRVERERARVRH